jgi:hypothetical protein
MKVATSRDVTSRDLVDRLQSFGEGTYNITQLQILENGNSRFEMISVSFLSFLLKKV